MVVTYHNLWGNMCQCDWRATFCSLKNWRL